MLSLKDKTCQEVLIMLVVIGIKSQERFHCIDHQYYEKAPLLCCLLDWAFLNFWYVFTGWNNEFHDVLGKRKLFIAMFGPFV